jgi:hypothetical protein
MGKKSTFPKLLVLLLFCYANPLWADTVVNVTNTLRTEYYGVNGDKNASPYQYTGWQPYDEVSLEVTHRKNPYNLWRFSMFGVGGDSDYRTPEDKIILERLNILKEQGDVALPYRIEAGDYYGFFSYRTLQTSLKGVSLEVQPLWGIDRGIRHSFLLLGGARQQTWNDFKLKEYVSSGFSYLMETGRGKYAFNTVYHRRYPDPDNDVSELKQLVISLAIEQKFQIWKLTPLLEGEIGYFKGDHQDLAGAGSGQNTTGFGYFMQLQNYASSPFFYRLRYEQYDEHYYPEGAAVSPDRRAYEFHLGYKFAQGLNTRLRLQRFEDNIHTSKTISDIGGLNLLGSYSSPKAGPFSYNIDMFIQKTDPDNGEKRTNKVINSNFMFPVFTHLNTRLGFSYMSSDDNTSSKGINFALDISHSLRKTAQTSVSPYMNYKITDYNTSKEDDMEIGLMLGLSGEKHNINGNLAYNYQNVNAGPDIMNINYGLTYQYRYKKSVFSIELTGAHRNPEEGGVTNSYRIAFLFTYYFSKKLTKKKPAYAAQLKPMPMPGLDVGIFSFISLGSPTSDVTALLAKLSSVQPVKYGNALIYEIRIFEEIERRQRLVILEKEGKVEKVAVIFDPVADPANMLKELARVNELMSRKYGSPSSFYEKGEISQNLSQDLSKGTFSRIYEWLLPQGGILRLGIPARVDGVIRIEVQYADSFPPYNYSFWSLETIK